MCSSLCDDIGKASRESPVAAMERSSAWIEKDICGDMADSNRIASSKYAASSYVAKADPATMPLVGSTAVVHTS